MNLILGHLVVDRKKEILSNLDPHINVPNCVIFAKEGNLDHKIDKPARIETPTLKKKVRYVCK